MEIVFIGGGNMARALIGGLQPTLPLAKLIVIDPNVQARQSLETEFACHCFDSVSSWKSLKNNLGTQRQVIVLAVKPQQLELACTDLAPYAENSTIVSIVAGARIAQISSWLRGHDRIVRTMPNTPALIGEGMTALFSGSACTDEDRRIAQTLLESAGKTLWVETESMLDAVTAVSGSGPAYVFLVMEAMILAAQNLGLNHETALQLVKQTLLGAAKLADASTLPPNALRTQVTSKGGTTAAALDVFQRGNLTGLFGEALAAAHQRSIELGKSS